MNVSYVDATFAGFNYEPYKVFGCSIHVAFYHNEIS